MVSRFNFSTYLTDTARVVNEFGIRNSECGMIVANCICLLRVCLDIINIPQTIAEHCKNGGDSVFSNAFVSDEIQRMGNISIVKECG